MKRYTIFGPNSVIVTKLDETETYGQLFNELLRAGQPLAYVTVGQNVPRDILNPNPGKLVSLTLGMGDVTWETFVGMPAPTRPVSTRGHRKAIELCVGAR
jgi:flagellar biosynthesis GTPase FlhF